MYALLAGLALFLLLWFGSRYFAFADTSKIARNIRRFGWVALFIIGGLLLLPGLLVIALPLAMLGYSLLQKQGIRVGPFGGMRYGAGYGRTRRRPGQKSFIRTNSLEMTLDHDSGRVDGRCTRGRFAGRALSELSMAELRELAASLQQGDPQEAALLQAYLNQRSPGWQDGSQQGSSQSNGYAGGQRRSRSSGGMSVEEAYEVLGVGRSASKDEIRTAHRQLMKRMHPDQGGSTYLAARINEAKEVLLSLH
jgi:hypothetical protein